jgi:MFS family permease
VLLRPDPLVVAGGLSTPSADAGRRSVVDQLAAIVRHRSAGAGLVTMVVAHGVMVSVMTMTPLHLRDHGGSLEIVGVVISLHIAGMYAFAPLVGAAADRLGHLRVARTAAVTLAAATTLAAGAGHHHVLIAIALVLLGLGWSMATISGATLLTSAAAIDERARTQGVADMSMGVVAGIGGTVSGVVVGTVGYGALSLVGAVLAGGLLVTLAARRPVPLPEPEPATLPTA